MFRNFIVVALCWNICFLTRASAEHFTVRERAQILQDWNDEVEAFSKANAPVQAAALALSSYALLAAIEGKIRQTILVARPEEQGFVISTPLALLVARYRAKLGKQTSPRAVAAVEQEAAQLVPNSELSDWSHLTVAEHYARLEMRYFAGTRAQLNEPDEESALIANVYGVALIFQSVMNATKGTTWRCLFYDFLDALR